MSNGFKQWLLEQGKSESTANKYAAALKGQISTWALEAGLIDMPLIDFKDPQVFTGLVSKIIQLDIFIEREARGNQMYSSALSSFSKFLNSKVDAYTELDEIRASKEITDTTKERLIQTRLGQGQFRKDLIRRWKGCSVTGYNDESLFHSLAYQAMGLFIKRRALRYK